MRSRYFSCSKFADWLRGTHKLSAGTGEEWRDWKKSAKESCPIRYWLAEEGLDYIQDFIMYPIDKLYSVKYWVVNRFVTKTHALTSTLEKGKWWEFDDRILYCLFDELVNFVEVEISWKNIICDKEAARKYNAPWLAKGWFRTRTWRNAQSGLDYLDWETTLTKDESYGLNKDDPEYGKPTDQAIKAQEISELYHWWKFTRPSRPDPYEISGWSEYCAEKSFEDSSWFLSSEKTEEERERSRKMTSLIDEIEEDYFQEDQEYLIRLISIRRSLWT